MPLEPYYRDDKAGIVIYHGDCREVLPTLESVSLTLTDPPFAVRGEEWDRFVDDFAFSHFTGTWLSLSHRVSVTTATFFPDRHLPLLMDEAKRRGIPYRRSLIWRKPPGSQMAGASLDGFWFDFEAIYVFGSGVEGAIAKPAFSVMDHRTVVGQSHGCQKPERLLESLVAAYAPDGGTVVDPFMGTGTTLRAAKDTGRRAIGIEIEERYCEIAANRLRQEVLFA